MLNFLELIMNRYSVGDCYLTGERKMKKINLVLAFGSILFVTGCAGPRITGSTIPSNVLSNNPDVLLINDDETREGFNEAMEDWLKDNKKVYTVKPEHTQHDPEKLTIEYVGYWKWDMALYLSRAEIEAFHGGQRIGTVNFKAPNSLNPNKWGSGEERIKLMMDVLYGKKTAKEATGQL